MDPGGAAVTATGDAGRGPLGGSSRLLPNNKHGRGGSAGGDSRANKQARTAAGDAVSSDATAARFSVVDGPCGSPGGGEHMLSFSTSAASSRPPIAAAVDAGTPLYYGTPASCSGLSSVSLSASMQGAMARMRGPFTPSQWIDLEHQALIYKYLAANMPIPHDLLIPIRRSLASSYSPAYFGTTSGSGWGPFQMGYSGNADLEPGRCRRTDGKKWRCSRDAVADQKYCERHMNRGRHRSRKHVEGQPGHAAKAMSVAVGAAAASATQPGALAASGTGATAAGLAVNQNQQLAKNYAAGASDPCSLQFNRELMTKQNESENMQESDNLSMLTSMNTRNSDSIFPFSKQNNPFEVTSSRTDLGLVSSDSLMSSHSSLQNVNLLSSQVMNEHQSSASLQQFVDWPRTPVQGGFVWPDPEDTQTQRTQLSVSAPMASSELSSASTSPVHEKLMLSPLKLSREYSSVGRSIAASRDEAGQVQLGNWMFRDSSMGGPLGEVLTKNSNAEAMNYMSAPALNLLTGCWDSSPGLDSSPVGVLQKTAFGSLSGSTGSSPRMENHHSAYGICNPPDDLGSIVVSHPSIRLL